MTLEPSRLLRIILLFEDRATRDHALHVLNHLVVTLAPELEIEIHTWEFETLLEPKVAWDSTELAERADIIVFSLHQGRDLPLVIKHWADSWADAREIDTGAIVGLIGLTADDEVWTSPQHQYLRELAERAHMDYLPQGLYTAGANGKTPGGAAKDTPSAAEPGTGGAFKPHSLPA